MMLTLSTAFSLYLTVRLVCISGETAWAWREKALISSASSTVMLGRLRYLNQSSPCMFQENFSIKMVSVPMAETSLEKA